MRIEVCGSIASGKTTLAAATAELGFAPCFERFQDNPFFAKFYADRNAYAFETEITFLLQHYSHMREATGDSTAVVDFSLALDLAYAVVTLEAADQTVFTSVLRRSLEKVGPPALIVRLECDSSIEIQRIRARARRGEEAISLNYLDAVDAALEDALASRWFAHVPVVKIDSHALDFRPGGADRIATLQQIASALRVTTSQIATD